MGALKGFEAALGRRAPESQILSVREKTNRPREMHHSNRKGNKEN